MSKTVINKRSQIIWDNGFAPDGQSLPKVSTSDAGKVLTVDEEGKWTAGEGGGGAEYTAGDNIQISADNVISATDTTYTAGDNVAISADNEISSVNTIVFNAKYFRATDTFQYDANAIAPFLTEVYKNDKRAIVRVQDGNYSIYDIYTLISYESNNNKASFSKVYPNIVSANQREVVSSDITLSVVNGTGTLTYTNEGVTDLPEGATQGQIPVADGHGGWVAGNIPTELPSVTSVDEGKVLKVDANGDWAVGTDNDTTYTAGTNVSISNGVISATDTTYTAGNGITITGTSIAADDQLPSVTSADEGKILTVDSNGDWVKGANDAGMVKAAIADDYAGADGTLPFYPIFSDAIASSGNMTRDCLAGQNSGWAGTAGARPYSTTRNDIYMAIYKKDGNYGIALFTTGNLVMGDESVKIQYINQDGTLQTDEKTTYITEAFTGTVNSGYSTGINDSYCLYHTNYSLISADLITCAKDLSLCVYNSLQDAITAFGAWQIPGTYSEGDQVWKDGKLQTYTNGAWVDSDPIVEQLEKELPSYSSADDGKVLSVDSNGDLEWATPSGGGASILMPDKSNKIKNQTTFSNGATYKATQDCFVEVFWNVSDTSGSDFYINVYESNSINAVTMLYQKYAPSTNNYSPGGAFTLPLKSGWTVKFQSATGTLSSSTSYYTVYGVK